jgi:hypothetical protein
VEYVFLFFIEATNIYIFKFSNFTFFFERKCGRESPYSDFGFSKIGIQICVCGDLNLGGWVVHPLP